MAKKVANKWYKPKVHTGWRKDMTELGRRRKVIMAYGGDYLSAGRAMLALSSVTKDAKTRRLAKSDSEYFFRKNQENKR
jgi:hypothetical protein